jgi:ABC-type multidrug transport system fused ATPase/permease subunit
MANGNTLFFIKRDDQEESGGELRSLFRVLRYIRPHRRLAVLSLGAAVLTTLFELVPPWLIKTIIDGVIKNGHAEWLKWLILGLVGAFLCRSLLNMARIRFNNVLEQRVIYDMRQDVYRALQRLSVRYFENRATGEIMSRVVNDVNNLESLFIDGAEAFLMAVFTLAGILGVLLFLNWKLAVVALLPIPFLVLGGVFFTRNVPRGYRLIHEKSAALNALIQDNLSGIREIMSFNRQGYEMRRFSRMNREFCRANLKVMRLWSLYSPGMIFTASWGVTLTLWFGSRLVSAEEMTIGTLVAFLGYLALFYTPVNQIHSINRMVQNALAAGARVFEVLDEKPEVADRPDAVRPPYRSDGTVRFEGVSFRYRSEVPVVENISFEAARGERVALVGPSGAGKSTLMKLLLRFHDVTEGRVTLDDRDVRDLKLDYLREQIGIVQQEPFLFNGTVRENILYGQPEAPERLNPGAPDTRFEAALVEAARNARAHEFILELPEGYETQVGERGVKLSVGQKQRIAIARALLKDPPIIIFDEATSNIDTETEVQIREALEVLSRDRTSFIIAHRLSSLRSADRILVVVDGRLAEQGTHDSLISLKGVYSSLYEAQFTL